MAADAQPAKSPPKPTRSSRPPPAPPRPPPARSPPPPPPPPPPPLPSSYGSISPFISPRSSLTFLQNAIRPTSFPPPPPQLPLPPLPPPPPATPSSSSGPLARVPSHPSLRPFLQIDFDAVAQQLSSFEGAPVTGEALKNSLPLPPPSSSSQQPSPAPTPYHSVHTSGAATPPVPLSVHISPHYQSAAADQSLVLKLRAVDDGADNAHPSAAQHAELENVSDASKGFAMSIPVTPQPLDPALSTWPPEPLADYFDEEAPLLQPPGIDLAQHTTMAIPTEGTAVVQRHGSKHDIEEQEAVLSVPETAHAGPNTGYIIPNYDSRENLTDLLVVVPPEHDEEPPPLSHKLDEVISTTTETAKEAIEQISNIVPPLPPIVDLESTVQVRGSAKNATLTMNVKREVSVVGYLILAVALFSVASQGTAVKWLPSVDGMIAAAWLMQCQTCLMVPFAVFQYLTMDEQQRWQWQQTSTMKLIVLASVSQVFWACGFFLAIDFTSLFHAWSLNNIHALTIVLIAVGRGMLLQKPSRVVSAGELWGARIAIGGVMLMQVPNVLSVDVRSLCGDMIAALSSLGAILFLDCCKELRQRIPLFLMMAPISALNSVTFSVSSMMIAGTDFSVTDHGALGWLQADRLVLGLYLGGVVGFLGTVSCIAALKYLPNVVVGSVQTMMPVVGTIVAVMMGAESLPDLWTTLGGAVLLYGVLVIADATRQSEVTFVLNEHLTADVRS